MLTKRWYIYILEICGIQLLDKGVADSPTFHINSVIAVSQMCNTRDQEMVVERSSPLSQSSDPTTANVNFAWDLIDTEFSSVISPVPQLSLLRGSAAQKKQPPSLPLY